MLSLRDALAKPVPSPEPEQQQRDDAQFIHPKGFIATHKPITLHHGHVRRLLYKVVSGNLNTIIVGKDGFGIKLEWDSNYLTIVPGVVNSSMPDDTMYVGYAKFWQREEARKHAERESKAKKKVAHIEEASASIIAQAQEDEIL